MDEHTYLAHHGILGMHWGIRRFQNKDGSYTSAGKRRRQQADAAADSEESKPSTSSETAPSSASSSESQQTAQAPPAPAPDPDEAPQREGMSPEQRRALLLAGAGVVAAATIIGVSLYNAKHEGNADAGKAFLEKAKTVKIPKIDVEDDATAAKDAATAVLKSREMEQKLRKFSETENPDPKAYQALSEAYFKAYNDAERATERKENVSKFVSANKDTILSDPKLVTKYADFLTSKDIASAKDHLSNKNNLRDARVKQAKAGAEWLGVITAVGGAVNEVYKLKNTDAAKAVVNKAKQ